MMHMQHSVKIWLIVQQSTASWLVDIEKAILNINMPYLESEHSDQIYY